GTCDREQRAPSIIGEIREAEEQQPQATGDQQEATQIEGQRALKLRLVHHAPANDAANDANGKVEIKNPAPIDVLGKIAPNHGTQRRSDEHRNAKDAIGQTALLFREGSEDQGKREREERCSSCSLEHTEENEDIDSPGEATQ